jgi:hypothetical protein
MRNRCDLVLKGYPLLRPLLSHRAIGASGVTWLDRNRQDCTCRIHDLDVTGYVPAGHWWPNYYETASLARVIASWVYFPDVNPGHALQMIPGTPELMPPAVTEHDRPLTPVSGESTAARTTVRPAAVVSSPSKSSPPLVSARQASPAGVSTSRTASSQPVRTAPTAGARQPGLINWLRNRGN